MRMLGTVLKPGANSGIPILISIGSIFKYPVTNSSVSVTRLVKQLGKQGNCQYEFFFRYIASFHVQVPYGTMQRGEIKNEKTLHCTDSDSYTAIDIMCHKPAGPTNNLI